MTRAVTLITVSTASLEDDQPLTDAAMRTTESVQRMASVTPDQWDLVITRDVGDFTVEQLHRMSAEQATTEWVSFIPEGGVLHPDALANALEWVAPGLNVISNPDIVLWRRSFYLEQMEALS